MFKYIKDLEALISSNEQNYYLYGNVSSPTSENTNPPTPSYPWQAIAKPATKSTETISSPYGSGNIPFFFPEDEFHRNGKTVDESDEKTTTNNVPIGFDSFISVTKTVMKSPSTTPQKMPPKYDAETKKRSNSWTVMQQLPSWPGQNPNEKPRICISYEDIPKEEIQSSQHFVSMDTIAQWLKSLRLHKYLDLFRNMTYEQMHNITEEQLIGKVTLGARNKLLTCIQKLKERYGVLCQMERDLLCGHIDIDKALDELSQIVLTPMKPFQQFHREDVASQFLKVLVLGE